MKNGFTLIEMAITISVLAVLLSITTLNLLNFQDKNALSTTIETAISDIKQQQLKSMNGTTEGNPSPAPYGIYFETNRYTLFTGNIYSSTDPYNFTTTLDSTLRITTTFPQNLLVFTKGSGEVQGFTLPNNTITIEHTPSGLTKTITINQYGTITNIQ